MKRKKTRSRVKKPRQDVDESILVGVDVEGVYIESHFTGKSFEHEVKVMISRASLVSDDGWIGDPEDAGEKLYALDTVGWFDLESDALTFAAKIENDRGLALRWGQMSKLERTLRVRMYEATCNESAHERCMKRAVQSQNYTGAAEYQRAAQANSDARNDCECLLSLYLEEKTSSPS